MANLTTNQIRALVFNAIGRASETSTIPFTALIVSTGNSGYSIGALQTDFGAFPNTGKALLDRYQAWAPTSSLLTPAEYAQAEAIIIKRGLGNSGERLPSTIETRLNGYLRTTEGSAWVSSLDEVIYTGKVTSIISPITSSQYFTNLSDNDGALMLARIAKAYNQNNNVGKFLRDEFVAGRLTDENFENIFEGRISSLNIAAQNALRSGQTNMELGVDLFNRLQASNGVIGDLWRGVVLSDPAMVATIGSDSSAKLFDALFRDPVSAERLLNNYAQSKPTLLLPAKSSLKDVVSIVGVDKGGTLFVYDTGQVDFRKLKDGEWESSYGNYPRSDLPILRRNPTGKWILALGDQEIDLSLDGESLAIVDINGTEVTLDASKPGQYAFLDSGDLVYAERNGALISGTRLTGANPGSFEVEFRGGSAANPDIRLVSFNISDPLADSQNDYRFVQTDAQGRVTTTDISPITRNVDGVDVMVGSSRFVGITQNGQPISQTSTELQTQAGTGNQITTTDAKLYSNGVLSSHTETTQISSASGLIPIETVVKTFGAQGTLVQTSTTTPDLDGSQNTIVRNGSGTTLYTSNIRYFDDDAGQSSLTETTYPNGRIETLATDTTGTPASLRITIPAGNNTETVDAYTFDASGQRVFNSSTTTETFYDENGQSRIETVTIPFGGSLTTTRQVYDTDGVLVSSEPVVTGSQANANVSNPQTTAVLNDISGLIGAIQGGQSLPILNSGVRLINTVANPAGSAIQYPGLNQASGALNGLASLYNLSNALQNGSDLDKLSATLNTLNYVNSTLPSLLGASSALSPALNSFLNGTTGTVYNAAADGLISNGAGGLINGGAPGVIPVIGLVLSIKNGDPFGTISGIIGIVNPALLTTPVGWILAIASIVYSLTKETPESWGTARIIFDANGQIGIDTVGEGSGPQRVRQQLDATLAALNQQIADVRAANPAALIGIVPQRTPSITWREQRQDDQGYAIVDIDPVTGQQRYPYLRFDDNGVPFSSNPAVWQPDPRDPGIRVRFDQQLTQSALRREAIAPQWVVDTARIQQDIGDPNAGLVEQERAAKLGLGAAYDAVTKEPTGQFRPITLDLDGNGTITIAAKDAASNTVAFDWNDSGSRSDTGQGFLKQVAWVQPNDGFLFVDRNLNSVAEVTGQTLKATESTTYLVAAPAIFYWARELKGSEKRAENDDCWRDVA
jgi:hypothetical protein